MMSSMPSAALLWEFSMACIADNESENKTMSVGAVLPLSNGVIKDNLQGYIDIIPGQPKKHEVHIGAIRGTVSILKRALHIGQCRL